jgi:hypothetical protein
MLGAGGAPDRFVYVGIDDGATELVILDGNR